MKKNLIFTLVFGLFTTSSFAEDVVKIGSIKLAIVELGFKRDRPTGDLGDVQAEVDDLAGSGGNLLVVEWDEDILWVAPVNPVAFAIEHIHIDKV